MSLTKERIIYTEDKDVGRYKLHRDVVESTLIRISKAQMAGTTLGDRNRQHNPPFKFGCSERALLHY